MTAAPFTPWVLIATTADHLTLPPELKARKCTCGYSTTGGSTGINQRNWITTAVPRSSLDESLFFIVSVYIYKYR